MRRWLAFSWCEPAPVFFHDQARTFGFRRSKKSWRPIAWLYCRFLIFTQVVASGV
jgi:hypothetical protein